MQSGKSENLQKLLVKNTNFCLIEIEMVIMERCKLSELSISAVTEQNTTDEEKSAAASGSEITNWNRYENCNILLNCFHICLPTNFLISLRGCLKSASNESYKCSCRTIRWKAIGRQNVVSLLISLGYDPVSLLRWCFLLWQLLIPKVGNIELQNINALNRET